MMPRMSKPAGCARAGIFVVALAVAAVIAASPSPAIAADSPRVTGYRNPVLPGFHPDPSVVRVGDWFYLVTSSFEFFPGVPIHRSRDLVHWEALGHVLTRDSQLPLATAYPSGGIFAPTIRYHAGTYYVITTNVTHRGTFYVTAEDPAGPWSEPIWIDAQGGGIDPSLFFDDDGKVYLTSTGNAPGIHQAQIDIASGKLLTKPRVVWPGTGGRYPEGPHLYKIAGAYYLMISEGGTEYGHMITIARSNTPWGPFEACPRNPILTHRNTPMSQPIQGTGHADLVQDAEGHWWMVFLAFRPQGGFYWQHLGRETFLAPVRWDAQGWPVINDGKLIALDMRTPRLPTRAVAVPAVVPAVVPAARDEFDGAALGPAWNFLRNPVRANYSTTEKPGWLTLHGTTVGLDQEKGVSPTFVGRRQEHLRARMSARIDFVPARDGEEAGLVLYRAPHQRYEIGVRKTAAGREVFLRQTVGTYISTVTAAAAAPASGPLVFEITAEPTRYTFAWGSSAPSPAGSVAAKLNALGAAEPRLLSTEVAGGFIGTIVGMYALAPVGDPTPAPAAFDWFNYEEQK
jgi:xylan 1,4-beta-xylosidase